MYLGKPVIVTDVKPLKRIVELEQCGLVVKYNILEVAEAINALTDTKLRDKLGKKGKKAAIKTYTWRKVSFKFNKVYKQFGAKIT